MEEICVDMSAIVNDVNKSAFVFFMCLYRLFKRKSTPQANVRIFYFSFFFFLSILFYFIFFLSWLIVLFTHIACMSIRNLYQSWEIDSLLFVLHIFFFLFALKIFFSKHVRFMYCLNHTTSCLLWVREHSYFVGCDIGKVMQWVRAKKKKKIFSPNRL